MLGECIASHSKVIRAIMSGYSPWCGGGRTVERALLHDRDILLERRISKR